MSNDYPQGSVWRKWDLQVHAPGDHLYDGYKTTDGTDPLNKFCDVLEASDVDVFGITDYFAFESFTPFIKRFNERHADSEKRFFVNIELRVNEAVNKEGEHVNVHLIFNPASNDRIPMFLSRLDVVKTAADGAKIRCSDLKSAADYGAATVTRESIDKAFEETFGSKAIRSEHVIVMTAANNDGLRPARGAHRNAQITDEIDKLSDGFFGGTQNIDYYLDENRYEDDQIASPKPVVATSDAHSFQDLESSLGKQLTVSKHGDESTKITVKNVTWIKADPTFEGLKQILYEPLPGERVSIGPVKPDEKSPYKVIRKIKFTNTVDFPAEIEFNNNLCSIIGSRSSGKSALLAYVAHSVSPEEVEELIDGPGQGDEFDWDNINLSHEIEWENGKSNTDSPGQVLFIPQNHLFEASKDPNEIKKKIEPILFKIAPKFASLYEKNQAEIEEINESISESIDEWFECSSDITSLQVKLKSQGDKAAVSKQLRETNAKVKELRKKNQLSEEEVTKYLNISAKLSELAVKETSIEEELLLLGNAVKKADYFRSVRINLTPSSSLLSENLAQQVDEYLNKTRAILLSGVNEIVEQHRQKLLSEKTATTEAEFKAIKDNKKLIEKYQKNVELEALAKSANGYAKVLENIDKINSTIAAKKAERLALEAGIAKFIEARKSLIEALINPNALNEQDLPDIKFNIEAEIDAEHLQSVEEVINTKERTDFVQSNTVDIPLIRSKPGDFLAALFSGSQKVIRKHTKQDGAKKALMLRETVLFAAEMEGDKIGGFSAPTMTPGKRALFALRLILAESEDTWPLLIDQPEDDLDSRSIYDEIVPFLKEKKKERQVIMVSHNANLVIGADSEQLIVTNRDGADRPNEDGRQFNYLTGSLEFTEDLDKDCPDTLHAQGICEHACAILDGGKLAFEHRKQKYHIR